MRASPESLRRIRLKTGSPIGGLRADGEAREAADHDILPGGAGELGAQLLDRLALVLVAVDVDLVEQDRLLHPLAQLALGDLAADLLRLVGRLLLEHAQLGLLGVLGDVVLGDPLDGRAGGDVQGDLAGEADEVVVTRHEVGVAVDLDEHADLAVGVDVGLHGALGGLAAAHLERLVAEADAQQLDGGVEVAVGLAERLLAVHHARARAVAQLLDLRGGDRGSAHLDSSSFFFVVFFFLGLSSSWTASATTPAAPAAASATAPSGPGARSATASATPSAVLAAVSATPCAVSTAWLAASCARSTTPRSSSPAVSSAAGASVSAAASGSAAAEVGASAAGASASAAGAVSSALASWSAGAAALASWATSLGPVASGAGVSLALRARERALAAGCSAPGSFAESS